MVHELEPGEQVELGGVTIAATPAVHEVRRRFRTVQALGFVAGERIYFAGDTDVFAGMARLGPVDTALLPVWGWGTSLGPGHMDPSAAAEAAALIGPGRRCRSTGAPTSPRTSGAAATRCCATRRTTSPAMVASARPGFASWCPP